MEENEETIFSLLELFKNKLKPEDWVMCRNNNVLLNEADDEIIITDTAKGRIAKELNELFEVKEK